MNDKWRCQICHELRDDKDISVASVEKAFVTKNGRLLGGGGFVGVNVKYCNDNPDCAKLAIELANRDAQKLAKLEIEEEKDL